MRQAACVLIRNKENPDLYLAISRKNDHTDFGLIGGKCDPDETHEQTAIREALEETGLTISNLKHIFTREVVGETDYSCMVFSADYDGEIAQQPGEGVVAWVDKAILMAGKSFGDFNTKLFNTLKH
jgi:8-oxo-dGTP pyrophosphatase MutT (NUDIX family)